MTVAAPFARATPKLRPGPHRDRVRCPPRARRRRRGRAEGAGDPHRAGEWIPYDHLVLATGARATPAYEHAITFGEDVDEEALHGLLRDAEESYVDRVAFVVPNETTWALPLYELALMTARAGVEHGRRSRPSSLFVTSEERPLAIFGPEASDAVAELLDSAAIEFVGSAYTEVEHNRLIVDPGGRQHRRRPRRQPAAPGGHAASPASPRDAEGFVPVDRTAAWPGLPGVYAAGDGTAFPIKQGGLATQQADAVAETIAAAAGAPIEPEPFKPVLRGMLLTGGDNRFMRSRRRGRPGRARRRDPRPVVAADQDREPLPRAVPVRPRRARRRSSASGATTSQSRPISPRPETCRTPGSPCHDPRAERSQDRSSSAWSARTARATRSPWPARSRGPFTRG